MKTLWIPVGDEPQQCPFPLCHSIDIWPTEVHGLWECQDCGRDFLVRYFPKPKPKSQSRGLTPQQVQALRRELAQKGGC